MRHLKMMALLVAAVALTGFASTTTGCAPLAAAVSDKPVLGGQKLDEQVMGGVDALGTSANVLIEAAAKSGLASRDQLLKAKQLRRDIDAAHAAAYAAYRVGDAALFSQKLAAVTELNKRATTLFNEVKK